MKNLKLLLLAIIFISWGCKPKVSNLNITCIGDSITYGSGIKNMDDTYPFQLEKMLGDHYTVRNYGKSGATMLRQGDKPYWTQLEYKNAIRSNPDLVIIMLGSNDTKPQNWKYKSAYKKDYKDLIHQVQNLSTHPEVWIALPPPAFKVKWGINDTIIYNELLPKIKEIAIEEGLKLIDLNTPFQNRQKLFPDFIHPNEAGAKVIADIYAKEIKKRYK